MSLAAVAPGLSEAELKVALHLASIEDPVHHGAKGSSRHIAKATRLSRSNVQRALDSLNRRFLITTREGTATRSSYHGLNFTQTTAFRGGLTAGPPPAQMALPGGPTAGPPVRATIPPDFAGVASQQGHPFEPVPLLDKDFDYELIDRVLTAKKADFPDQDIAAVRQAVHGYSVKLRGDHATHPPDDRIAAQILTAANGNVDQVRNLIQDLWIDRTVPGDKYGWYLAVVLQRWHGIRFHQVKTRSSYLKLVKAARRQSPPEPTQENLEFAGDLVATLAKSKGMGR
jgi:hypothetical protein